MQLSHPEVPWGRMGTPCQCPHAGGGRPPPTRCPPNTPWPPLLCEGCPPPPPPRGEPPASLPGSPVRGSRRTPWTQPVRDPSESSRAPSPPASPSKLYLCTCVRYGPPRRGQFCLGAWCPSCAGHSLAPAPHPSTLTTPSPAAQCPGLLPGGSSVPSSVCRPQAAAGRWVLRRDTRAKLFVPTEHQGAARAHQPQRRGQLALRVRGCSSGTSLG